MKSALKILLPIALLLAVVFGVTFLSRTIPPDDTTDTKNKTEGPPTNGVVFFSATRKAEAVAGTLDPFSKVSLQDVAFPGFYEPGEATHATHFWFENRNPFKVTLRLIRVSCTSCSGGRVAPIPPDAVRALRQMAAVSALPFGPVAGCPTGMGGIGAFVNSRLQWQAHAFKDGPAGVIYDVPAAADTDGWTPSWGILELNFKVKPNPTVPLRAAFATVDEANQLAGTDSLSIFFDAVVGVELDKSAIDAGELADNSPVQTHTVMAFSLTRTADEIPGLNVRVIKPGGGDPGPFVKTGKLERVPDGELDRLSTEMSAKAGRATRIKAAFRVPVTITAKSGDARPDIGRLDREVWVTAAIPGMEPRKVTVKAMVAGPVALTGGATELGLGSFKYETGTTESAVVVTEQPGAVLEVVPGAAVPDFLGVSLKKLPDAAGRGQWQLTVRVPPNRVQGEITDGMVVLELKGPNPQRVRIPIRGRGAQ